MTEANDDRPRTRVAGGADLRTLAARAALAHPSARGAPFDVETLYTALIEHTPAVVYLDPVDEDLDTIYVSPQVEEMLGVTPEEWVRDPRAWARHVHPDDLDRAWDEYVEAVAAGVALQREYRMVHEDGSVRWVLERATTIMTESGEPWLVQGLIFDITGQRESEQLAFLAYHDKLTGLPNRSLFEELLGLALGRARRAEQGVGLLFIDFDNFKQVNDAMGHAVGDRLLAMFAERVKPVLREADVFARRSGDEFLVLLTDLPGDAEHEESAVAVAERVAGRVHEALLEPFELPGCSYTLSASIGISLVPRDASDGPTLLRHADEAMYRSKRTRPGGHALWGATGPGLDTVVPADPAPLAERIRRAAVDRSWVLHWQPVVDLADGRVCGVEALIRWRDQNGGLVPPGEFLPLAEEMGLIESIGEWVVDELGRQHRAWREVGVDLQMGFNLSPRQLWSPRLSESLLGRLRDAGVEPRRVTVEVSEATAMADPDRAQQVLYELRAWGLGIAIDDFGVGHASLARMSVLPADVLKIDRSLIRGIDGDPELVGMVRASIALAKSLAITPLAVGVETETEAATLRELGCEMAQGFLFGRPLPGERIPDLVREADLLGSGIPQAG
jgi:diguanylate cyclase (GGDEF)-like protein/PAS domain S-box-containing protein